MAIRRVAPLSVAKISGALYAIMGLFIGAIFSLISIVSSAFAQQGSQAGLGVLFGAAAIIALPIFYGVVGFIGSALAALIYNALAGWLGGIEIEVDARPTA